MKKSLLTLAAALSLTTAVNAAETFSGYELANEGAWCWFADPRAMHNPDANASYVGYIDVHGNIKATQYDFANNSRSEVLVRSYFQPDDHDNPTFLTLPDGRILIIYSRHTDERAFYYRISKRPGDISDLGDEKKITTSANTTYPSPFILSDDPEHFYLCWRGIGWHPTIARFTLPDANDEVTADWGPFQMVQSTGARPYAKYYSNGKDKLYMTYTTGHPDNEQPNWVYFNAININATKGADGKVSVNPTLEDVNGTKLSTIADGKFAVNKQASYKTSYPATVVSAPSNTRDWVWQLVNDSQGRPTIAMVRIDGGKTKHEYYLAKWVQGQWRLSYLADGGGRFHSSNTEYCYSGGMAIDPQDASVVYLSIPTEGSHGKVYEIWKYTLNDDGSVASKEQVTENSVKNNVRPYILPASQGSPLRLAWMNGDYFYWMVNKNYPAGYPTDLRCDYDYSADVNADAVKAAWTKDFGMAAPTATDLTVPAGKFTVSMTLGLDADNYGGVILTGTGFEYGVNKDNAKPYLTIGGKKYESSNVLYTSDAWAANSTGTSGDNWATKPTSTNFTITYDGANVTVYRNGLIDQVVAAASLNPGTLKINTFPGHLGAVSTYAACLNQDEVKYAMSSSALDAIAIPEKVYTHLILPDKVNAQNVVWTSSHPAIIGTDGIFNAPVEATEVELTCKLGGFGRTYKVTAMPRDIAENLVAEFTFEPADLNGKVLRDLTGNGHDMTINGTAKVDGTLNLTANSAEGFSTNGHGVIAPGLLNDLRSYTVCFTAKPSSLIGAPRFYDFGSAASNSVFFRAATPAAGIKYNGGTTTMVESSTGFTATVSYKLAVTFEAATHTTIIYVDGKAVASGTKNVVEPYMLTLTASDNRNYVGRTQWWDGSYAADNRDYIGTIDDLRIYNTALTSAELALLQGFNPEYPELNTDCTNMLANPDFEGSYTKDESAKVDSDRAIYRPEGWTLSYSNGNQYDLSAMNSSSLYANLFDGLPELENGGRSTYRVRQRWGSSQLGLNQVVKGLPAACYRLSADAIQKGSGDVYLLATNSEATARASFNDNGAWERPSANITVNGVEDLTIGFNSNHVAEVELLMAVDNFTLLDVTANSPASELFALLGRMKAAADELLKGTLSNEDARTALTDAATAAGTASGDADKETLMPVYTALRDALAEAQKDSSSIASVTVADETEAPLYDLSGRKVTGTPAAGLYLQAGRKVIVK